MTVTIDVSYGSIGQQHAQLLRDLGCEMAAVSRRLAEQIIAASKRDASQRRWILT